MSWIKKIQIVIRITPKNTIKATELKFPKDHMKLCLVYIKGGQSSSDNVNHVKNVETKSSRLAVCVWILK